MLREAEYFFGTYKELEGKRVDILGWDKRDAAMHEITRSMALYSSTYGVQVTP